LEFEMNAEKAKRITDLATDLHDKRARYYALGMTNAWGKSSKSLREQTVEYELAHAEYLEASALLERAMSD
jgi:hypothetical protein